MSALLVVVAIGIGTYLIRLSFIGLVGDGELPVVLRRPLQFIAPAVLAALVVPAVLRPEGQVDVTLDNLRLPAALVAAAVAWRTRSVAATTVAGLGVLWLLQAFL